MRGQEDVMQVYPVKLVAQLQVGVGEPSRMPQPMTYVVDEHIQPAVSIEHLSSELADLMRFTDVGQYEQCRPAGRGDLIGDALPAVSVDLSDDHMGAMLSEQSCGRRTDTATAAR